MSHYYVHIYSFSRRFYPKRLTIEECKSNIMSLSCNCSFLTIATISYNSHATSYLPLVTLSLTAWLYLAVLSSVFMTLFFVILSLSLFCNYNFVSSKRNLTYLKTVTFYLTMWLYFAIMTLFHVNVTSYLKIATFYLTVWLYFAISNFYCKCNFIP